MPGDNSSAVAAIEFRELPLFEGAHHWRTYWSDMIRPYVGGNVLEVGAGIGSATKVLANEAVSRWVCLEPDAENFRSLQSKVSSGQLPWQCTCHHGDLRSIGASERFDTILYIDVLEHIRDDVGELALAADRLQSGGRLVVLSPAHQMLFTEFDRAIGHYRRYSQSSLLATAPPNLRPIRIFYLDSVGMAASLGNRLLMHAAEPPEWSIWMWDRIFVPASRTIDKCLFHTVGKTVVGVWRRNP
jgi:protein-L-isoaspartate O-methyltransferase